MPILERPAAPALYYELDDYTDPWRNAPYILLQHGFARSSKFWQSWVPYLARWFKVIRPDLRGFGRSSRDFDVKTRITGAAYIGDLEAILDALGVESVHYCGESMGGIVGMLCAAERPARVRTLSLVSTPVYLDVTAKNRSTLGYRSQEDALRTLGARGYAQAKNTTDRFAPGTDPGLMAWFAEEQGKSDVEVMIATQKLIYALDPVPYLPRIEAPVLAMYPSHDTHTNAEQLAIFRKSVRNCTIVNVPSHYHNLHLTHRAACANEVLHFAARHEGFACHEP